MPFKINIGNKGKSWKFELESESLLGKNVGETIDGKELKAELEGYQLEITGASDTSGFPLSKDVEGIALKRVLLTKGWGMRESGQGLRKRKTVRGKRIALTASQINFKVITTGSKKLEEVFPDQNKPLEPKVEKKAEVAAA